MSENEEKIAGWLRDNDQRLYTGAFKIRAANRLCATEVGFPKSISPALFRRLRQQNCHFWRQRRCRKFSDDINLDWRQWDQFRQWCIKNRDLLGQSETIEFVARLMRSDGLVVSPMLLRNSCSFMAAWKESRKQRAIQSV